jgi:hypothetical protein
MPSRQLKGSGACFSSPNVECSIVLTGVVENIIQQRYNQLTKTYSDFVEYFTTSMYQVLPSVVRADIINDILLIAMTKSAEVEHYAKFIRQAEEQYNITKTDNQRETTIRTIEEDTKSKFNELKQNCEAKKTAISLPVVPASGGKQRKSSRRRVKASV